MFSFMHRFLTGKLKVENLTVAIADLPPSLQGTKIVQLSDFHYDGFGLSQNLLAEAIATTNQAEPDLIVLTGDYITSDPNPIYDLILHLKNLQSRLGIYAVLGNHDLYYHHSKREIIKALNSIGIQVLWNQIAYPFGPELALVGLADFRSSKFNPARVIKQLDPTIPRIVLSHNPDSAEILQQWRVDLQLSGHTHGGQIRLPFFGPVPAWLPTITAMIPKPLRPFLPFVRKDCRQLYHHWEWAQGFHQIGNNSLYVNRGLGTYLPGRLFCPPEVTVIRLVRILDQ